jgi:hypothetical protein
VGKFIGYHDELLTLVAAQRSHLGIPEKGKPWTTTKTVTYNRAKHQLAHPYRLIQIISPHFQLACKIFCGKSHPLQYPIQIEASLKLFSRFFVQVGFPM